MAYFIFEKNVKFRGSSTKLKKFCEQWAVNEILPAVGIFAIAMDIFAYLRENSVTMNVFAKNVLKILARISHL
jgi:hypothetical protein